MQHFLQTVFSALLVCVLLISPLTRTLAETVLDSDATTSASVPQYIEDQAQPQQTSEELDFDTTIAPTDSGPATSSATTTEVEESSTNTSPSQLDGTEDVSVRTPQATTSLESETSDTDTLQSLSTLLAGFFAAEAEQKNLLMSETIPIYDLDQPIRIRVTPQMAVVIEEEPSSLIENVVEEVREWFGAGTDTQEESPNDTEIQTTDTAPDGTNSEAEDVSGEPVTPLESGDNQEIAPQETEKVDSEASVVENSESTAYRIDRYCRWWELLCVLTAHAEDALVIEEILEPVLQQEEAVDDTTNAPAETDTATSTDSVIDFIENTNTEPMTSTSTGVVLAVAEEISTSTEHIAPPLVSLGSTSIAAELTQSETGEYFVVIPPGGLPFGIHELVIATSTAQGDIHERIVVDYGGGYIRQIHLDAYGTLLVTTNEEGQQALWLWQESAYGASVHNLVLYGEYTEDSPIGLFDDFVFYLSSDEKSLHGYDLISGVTFSHSIEVGRDTIKTPLRSGEYHIIRGETGFQFVSVIDAIYYRIYVV